MNLLDLVLNLAQFFWEASMSYAQTDEGKRHLQKVADDAGITADELAATEASLSSVIEKAASSLPNFNYGGAKGSVK